MPHPPEMPGRFCPTCGGPIVYKAVDGPKFEMFGTTRSAFWGQISEGLWCEKCNEPQPW